MTAAWHALGQLASWPDLAEVRPSCGTGRALRSPRAEIAHFHSEHSVDLHLTTGSIRRFEHDLRHSSAIQLIPGSHWITVRVECESDVSLLLTLMSAALQAHQLFPDTVGALSGKCNDSREAVLAHRVRL